MSTGPPVIVVPTIAPGTAVARREDDSEEGAVQGHESCEQYSDSFPAAWSSVSPTGHARKFSTITLTVSHGPEIVRVPDDQRR